MLGTSARWWLFGVIQKHFLRCLSWGFLSAWFTDFLGIKVAKKFVKKYQYMGPTTDLLNWNLLLKKSKHFCFILSSVF